MSLLIAGKAFDLRDVSLDFHDGVGVSIYFRKIVATTTFSILVLKISLVLVFFTCLALVSAELLMLTTSYFSRGTISGLSSFGVLLFFFCGLILPRAP